MLSATADTNVYISGLSFGGEPRRFLSLAEAGVFELTVSDEILAEIAKVLAYRKIGWPLQRIQEALRQISRYTKPIKSTQVLQVILIDPPDNRILECAVVAKSQFLVTGDPCHRR